MLRAPMAPSLSSNLAAVRGISVGHWTDLERATGCTVVLGPEGGMRAACAVRGRATGTRELDALHPRHLVGHVDAILLTGGWPKAWGPPTARCPGCAGAAAGFPAARRAGRPFCPPRVALALA